MLNDFTAFAHIDDNDQWKRELECHRFSPHDADHMAHLFRDTNPGIDSAHKGVQGANGVALKPAPSQKVLKSRPF